MTHTEEANPFTQRRFVLAAVVVAVVVVMGVILALTLGNADPEAPAPVANPTTSPAPSTSTSSPAAPTPTPAASADADASVCGLPAGDQTIPSTPPAATWQLVGTMAMPASDDIGPGITSPEGIHSCYAHNPTGALYAAVGLMADSGAVSDQAALMALRMAPGPARDAAVSEAQQRATESADGMPDGYGGEIRMQVAGFQFVSATERSVSLIVAVHVSGRDGYMGIPGSLEWIDGDWLMSGGAVTPISLPSLAGYVTWGGA